MCSGFLSEFPEPSHSFHSLENFFSLECLRPALSNANPLTYAPVNYNFLNEEKLSQLVIDKFIEFKLKYSQSFCEYLFFSSVLKAKELKKHQSF